MERLLSQECTNEEAGIVAANVWRILELNGQWFRVRPLIDYGYSVTSGPAPGGKVAIERLDNRPDGLELANEECRLVISMLFPHI